MLAAVKPLEDVPDGMKDWHPGSNGQVLDLVHPSICPLIYHQTHGKQRDGTYGPFLPPTNSDVSAEFQSQRFQWLPSDFSVDENGMVKLISPYINNIHPTLHESLVPILERVMQGAIPLWERVLSDLRREALPMRLDNRVQHNNTYTAMQPALTCIWKNERPYPDEDEEEEFERDEIKWYSRQPMVFPDCTKGYDGSIARLAYPIVDLKSTTLQVIVKLANIVLTPENPKYQGGVWHVEGM